MEVKHLVVGQYKFNGKDGKKPLLDVTISETGVAIKLHWGGMTPTIVGLPIDAARELAKFLAEYLPEEEA